jgi:hypothetical protein
MADGIRIPIQLVDQMSAGLRDIEGKLGGFGRALSSIGSMIGASFSARAVIEFGKQLFISFAESERAVAKFEAALRAAGTAADVSTEAITKLASETQSYTTFNDEATLSAAAMLESLAALNQEELEKAIPITQDFAAAMGMDLESAATLVAKALEGNAAMLSRYGIKIDEAKMKIDPFNAVMDALNQKFHGMAQALGETTLGKLEILKNQFDDLKEKGGALIAEFAAPFISLLTVWVGKLNELIGATLRWHEILNKIQSGKPLTSEEAIFNTQKEIEMLKKLIETRNRERSAEKATYARAGMLTSQKEADIDKRYDAAIEQIKITIAAKEKAIITITEMQAEADAKRLKAQTEAAAKAVRDAMNAVGTGAGAGAPAAAPPAAGPSYGQAYWKGALAPMGMIREDKLTDIIDKGIEAAMSSAAAEEAQRKADEANEAAMMRALKSSRTQGDVQPVEVENVEEFAAPGAPGLGGPRDRGAELIAMLTAAFQPVVDILGPMVTSLSSIQAIMNPLQTILTAMMDMLGPLINELLAPIVGILVVLGQALAQIIAPLLKLIAPVIKWIAEAFVWLYNNAIVPLANGFLKVIYAITALGLAIFYLVTFQWGKLDNIRWTPPSGAGLTPISTDTLTSAGTEYEATHGGSGGGAEWSTGRQMTFNIYVNAQVIAGDPGIRNLALLIRDEIRAAEALGY